jgi:Peptidyl-prolyl cis-trans isomerase (rotamase) - cyclophilin family
MKNCGIFIFIILISIFLITSCADPESGTSAGANLMEDTDMVQIIMENGGVIKIELYPDIAPVTVANFKKLISEGFYDGLIFHRVIENFMIQCGDPTGTGMGGSSETIVGEFSRNGFENKLSHDRGVISMGRKGNSYDSASSHFFICHAKAPHLDGQYASFGKVVEGMDIVDQIATVDVDSNDMPLVDQKISSMTLIEE